MILDELNPHKTENIFAYLPGCRIIGTDIVFTTDIEYKSSLSLKLYDKKDIFITEIDLKQYRVNAVLSSVEINDPDGRICFYEYIADETAVLDKYMMKPGAVRCWGDNSYFKSAVYRNEFNWGDDILPGLKACEITACLLHVRGYSMLDTGISKDKRGTFSALSDKVRYFNEMGINQLILMPCYDFDEVIVRKNSGILGMPLDDMTGTLPKTNYWGYTHGRYLIPKCAYSRRDPVDEFKSMVSILHSHNIEVIMQFYFPEDFSRSFCADVLKYWTLEYHVDGFYILGNDLPVDIICDDKALAGVKLYFDSNNTEKISRYGLYKNGNIFCINRGFMNTVRRFAKSDEDTLKDFISQMYNNPADIHTVNCITLNEGFTLYDLVSYDRKHNEGNCENNRDGNDYNYSWNCGFEGYTRRKNITSLRKRQIKNLLTMLLTSQGTVLLLGGDENLNSQEGNNNAYCQDNRIGYIDWKVNKDRSEIQNYLRELISLRQKHPILHMDSQVSLMDTLSCGYPDMSFHQDDAYRPLMDRYLRHIAFMLCGNYAKLTDGTEDDFFYVAFNMHWEKHSFAVPRLPKNLKWEVVLFTGDETERAEIENSISQKDDVLEVPYRSIAVLKSSHICT